MNPRINIGCLTSVLPLSPSIAFPFQHVICICFYCPFHFFHLTTFILSKKNKYISECITTTELHSLFTLVPLVWKWAAFLIQNSLSPSKLTKYMKWKLLTSFPLHSPGLYHGRKTGGSNNLYIQHTHNWQFICFPFNKDHLVKQDSWEQCVHQGWSLSLNLKLKSPHCKLHIKLDSLSFRRRHPFLLFPPSFAMLYIKLQNPTSPQM